MRHSYWVKLDNERPQRMSFENMEEMWHYLRELFLRTGRIIEWIIRD